MRTDCNTAGTVNSGWSTIQTFTTPLRLEDETSSVDEFDLIVFPNPFSDKISIQSNSNDVPELISIYDVSGKLLLNFESTDLKNEFDLSSLCSGIYFCRIKSNENFRTFKLIKN